MKSLLMSNHNFKNRVLNIYIFLWGLLITSLYSSTATPDIIQTSYPTVSVIASGEASLVPFRSIF